jgi:hypothetical protein
LALAALHLLVQAQMQHKVVILFFQQLHLLAAGEVAVQLHSLLALVVQVAGVVLMLR